VAKAKTKSKTASAKKAAPKKSTPKSTAKTKKTAGSKAASNKAAAKKSAPKKAAAKKAPVSKSAAKKATAKKSAAKMPAVKKAAAAKAVAKKATTKAAPVKAAAVLSLDKARANKQAPTATLEAQFTPLDNRILIRRMGQSDRTPGGLYIPDTVSERPNQGQVVAVGRGHLDKKGRVQPLDVQLGDMVMFGNFSGTELKLNGEELLVLREDEILAIMKP
jgi:chaperonin GroES